MNRWMTKLGAAALLGGMSLSLGSCAHNDDMLVIVGAMYAQPPDCSYSPSASSKLLLSGTVDLGFGGTYTAVLLVANQLASRGSKARLRAETSNVTINNAEVHLLANGVTEIGYFSVPASGYLAVGSGEDSGYGAIAVSVMPGSVAVPSGTGYIIAEIQLQGTTLGGADIDSNLFRFEIFVVDSRIHNGGLVYYTSLDPDTNECSGSSVCTNTNHTVSSCYPGQDAPISCCDCGLSFCVTPP
jgi:hypothetical protein